MFSFYKIYTKLPNKREGASEGTVGSLRKIELLFSEKNRSIKQTKQQQLTKQQPLIKMSVTKQIVNLLSAKYNFSSVEGLEYVTTQLNTLKTMTKEEKAALRNQQKEQANAAKEEAKAEEKAAKEQAKAEAKAAKKSEKKSKKSENNEEKIKKPRTEAQIAATAKMIQANKLKKLASIANK
jgi:hypothetical protein